MKNKYIQNLLTVLAFGGLWGLVEATLGTYLHLDAITTLATSSTILVPIGAFLMLMAYKQTGKKTTIMYVGFVTAAIKLLVIFLPGMLLKPWKIVNPAASIVIESLVLFGAVALFKVDKILSWRSAVAFLAFNVVWRGAFIGHQEIMRAAFAWGSLISRGGTAVSDFMIKDNLASDVLALVVGGIAFLLSYLLAQNRVEIKPVKLSKAFQLPVVQVALAVVLVLGGAAATLFMK